VWRFGDAAIAFAMNGLRTVGMGITGFAALAATSAAIAGVLGWRLSRSTDRKATPAAQPAPQA